MPAGSKKASIRKTGSGHRGRGGRYAKREKAVWIRKTGNIGKMGMSENDTRKTSQKSSERSG
jgi:hypothetical protein